MNSATNELLSKLNGVRERGQGKWTAKCPAHEDNHASLSLAETASGRILVKCHAGCNAKAITEVLGLTLADLFADKRQLAATERAPRQRRQVDAIYDYTTADGTLLYQAVRLFPKDFRQRQPDGNGGWTWNLNGVNRVLYRLPGLLKADPDAWVFVCEGEKDVDNLISLGLTATCNAAGAGKWHTVSDTSVLNGRKVCVIADKDEPGRKHARDIAERLKGCAATVCVIEMPGERVKDASDWIALLDCREPESLKDALLEMAEASPEWSADAVIGDPLADFDAELSAVRAGLRQAVPLMFTPKLLNVTQITAPGGYAVVAGKPGSKKSFFALSMLVSACRNGVAASYLPLECDRAFHIARLLGVIDGSWYSLPNPERTPQENADAAETARRKHDGELKAIASCILENPCKPVRSPEGTLSTPEVYGKDVLRIIEGRAETDKLIIIDPFAQLDFEGHQEWREQGRFIGRLRGLAEEFHATIILVCHLHKNAQGPFEVSHVEASSKITKLAWTVLGVQSMPPEDVEVWAPGQLRRTVQANVEITVGKTRSGSGSGIRLAYSFGHDESGQETGPRFLEHGIVAGKRRVKVTPTVDSWSGDA